MCFCRVIGIPMWSDPASLKTKLILYYCERKWYLQTKNKQDLEKARVFSTIFRFIIDSSTFDNDEFENNYNGIYPNEPELNKKNVDSCKFLFLDLSVEAHDTKC